MPIDFKKLIDLIPVVAGIANPAVGGAASLIITEAEKIIAAKKAADPTLTTDQILAQAQAQWEKNIADAEALKKMGHP